MRRTGAARTGAGEVIVDDAESESATPLNVTDLRGATPARCELRNAHARRGERTEPGMAVGAAPARGVVADGVGGALPDDRRGPADGVVGVDPQVVSSNVGMLPRDEDTSTTLSPVLG